MPLFVLLTARLPVLQRGGGCHVLNLTGLSFYRHSLDGLRYFFLSRCDGNLLGGMLNNLTKEPGEERKGSVP